MSRLLLVRHGETELQSSLRYWGSTDVLLSVLGHSQAELLRERLSTEKIDFIYSSSLKRALATAQIIASQRQLPVTVCPELREIDFGKLEGLTFDEINQQFPDVAQQWIKKTPALAYPGGESLAELDERIGQFRMRLDGHADSEAVLVVAHSGVLRTLICQLMGWESRQRWQVRLDLASLSVVETFDNDAIFTLLNDTGHLKEGKPL
jgi:alpha-ribazole phosphatase